MREWCREWEFTESHIEAFKLKQICGEKNGRSNTKIEEGIRKGGEREESSREEEGEGERKREVSFLNLSWVLGSQF